MSFFDQVTEAPPDPILGINLAFQADQNPNKINLGVGAYRTDEGKPHILDSVRKAEQVVYQTPQTFNKEYLPIDGYAEFNKLAARLILGELANTLASKIVSSESISGTGAVRLGAEFISKFFPPETTVYISEPTWPNHKNMFNAVRVPWKPYRYWNRDTNDLDFEGMCEDIRNAPPRSVIIFHACAHNPTGVDPTPEQWEVLSNIVKERGHFAFFDSAYQGFASGDLDRDAYAIRLFAERGHEMFIAQSFAKNFGLYGERIGAFHMICGSEGVTKAVRSQLKIIIRSMYSSPPAHGAYIVYVVLSTPELLEEWKSELKAMAGRIHTMRAQLFQLLKDKDITWPHVMKQIGMFSYTGLTPKQVELLKTKHHIYMTTDGRISLPGLNSKNVQILANAIHDVIHNANL